MKRTGSIHFAKYEASERLQRTLDYVIDGKQYTTRDIRDGADICAVSSAIDELRENGFDIPCIKKCKPAIYQLADPEAALQLAIALLDKKKAA